MIIVYASQTGNVKRFVSKIRCYATYSIDDYDDSLGQFVLITYTTGFGQVPKEVRQFLDSHSSNMVAVVASGNMNWGSSYCKSGEVISKEYRVPYLYRFEMAGTMGDAEQLEERIEQVVATLHRTEQRSQDKEE